MIMMTVIIKYYNYYFGSGEHENKTQSVIHKTLKIHGKDKEKREKIRCFSCYKSVMYLSYKTK